MFFNLQPVIILEIAKVGPQSGVPILGWWGMYDSRLLAKHWTKNLSFWPIS